MGYRVGRVTWTLAEVLPGGQEYKGYVRLYMGNYPLGNGGEERPRKHASFMNEPDVFSNHKE